MPGGSRPKIRPIRTRILAGQTRSTHQCQGTFGFHSDHKKSSKTQRKSFPFSRQHHSLLVSKKARGKNGKIQPSSETVSSMVHGKTRHFRCSIGKKFRHACRPHFKTPHGQRRLHPKLGIIPFHGEKILTLASQHHCMVDKFASPGNKKFHKFVSRLPHWEAWGWMP